MFLKKSNTSIEQKKNLCDRRIFVYLRQTKPFGKILKCARSPPVLKFLLNKILRQGE